MEDEGIKAQAKGKRPCVKNQGSASAATCRKTHVKRKRPRAENPSSATAAATTGRKARIKGKRSSPRVENPSSASAAAAATTETEDEIDFVIPIEIQRAELALAGTIAPRSPYYVDYSEYPPGTDIKYELHWEDDQVVKKVPRWAREDRRLRLKYHEAAEELEVDDRPESPVQDLLPLSENPSYASLVANGIDTVFNDDSLAQSYVN